MADNRVQYLIDILPNTSELKKKLKANDVLNFSDISDIKKLIIDEVKKATSVVNKEAPKMRNAIQNGLSIDTSDLQKKLEFIAGLMGDLEKTAPMESWAKRGKGVYDTFVGLQNSVGALAKDVKVLQDSLGSLTTSFEGFKKSYQSFNPTQFVKVGEEVKKVNDQVVTGIGQIATVSTKVDEKLQKLYNSVINSENKIKELNKTKISLGSSSDATKKIKDLQNEFNKLELDGKNLKDKLRAVEITNEIDMIMSHLQKHSREFLGFSLVNIDSKEEVTDYVNYYKKEIKNILPSIEAIKTKYNEALKSVGKDTSPDALVNQLKDVKLSLRVPQKSELVGKINTLIDSIKPKDLHSIQTNITPTLDDAANIIEDKNKRAYKSKSGEMPASEDAVTDSLVTKTQNRFTRLEEVINKSRERITTATEAWRADIIKKFQIGKNDLKVNFKWQGLDNADTLWNELQDYFDKNAIDINVSFKNLSKQIEGALKEQNITLGGGGTANIDPNVIMNAVYQGMVAAFTGQALPVNIINTQEVASSVDGQVQNDTPKQSDDTPESSIKLNRDVAQKSLELLKQIAKIATKTKLDKDGNTVSAAPKGVKRIEDLFSTYGLKLTDIANETNDDVIFTKLQDALTRVDEKTGLVIGRTIGRTLQETDYLGLKVSGPRSAGFISESLGRQIEELLRNAGIKTESGDEASRRARRLGLLDDVRAKSQQYYPAYQAFDKVASNKNFNKFVKNPGLLNIEDVDAAITQLEAVGGDSSLLGKLKDARLQLGDSKDLDALEKFKAHAYNFLEQSKDVYKWLNDHMGNFKGTIYRPGRRPWNVNNAAGIANLPQDAKIDDVTIYRAFGQNYTNNPDMVARTHRQPDIKHTDIIPEQFRIQERDEKELKQTIKSQESNIKNISKLTKKIKEQKKNAEGLAQTVEKIKNDIDVITTEVKNVSLGDFNKLSEQSALWDRIVSSGNEYSDFELTNDDRKKLVFNTEKEQLDTIDSALKQLRKKHSDKNIATEEKKVIEQEIEQVQKQKTELQNVIKQREKNVDDLSKLISSINDDQASLDNINKTIATRETIAQISPNELESKSNIYNEQLGNIKALQGIESLRNTTLPTANVIDNVILAFEKIGLSTKELEKLRSVAVQYNPYDIDSSKKDSAKKALEEQYVAFVNDTGELFKNLHSKYGNLDVSETEKTYNLYRTARWDSNAFNLTTKSLKNDAQVIEGRLDSSKQQVSTITSELANSYYFAADNKKNTTIELANQLREVREKLYKEAQEYVKIVGKNPDDQVALGKLQQVLSGLQSNTESFAKIENLVDVPLYDKKTQATNVNKWTKKYLKDTPSVLGSAKGELTTKTEELDELNKTLAITEAKKRLAEDIKKQHIIDEKELEFVKQYNELLRQEKELLKEINDLQKQGADRKTISQKYSERYAVDSEIKALLQNNPDDNRHAYGFKEAEQAQNDLSSLALQRRAISNEMVELKALESELKSAKFFTGKRAKEEVEALKTTVANQYRQQLIDEINKDFGPVESLTATEKENYNDAIRKTITQRREYRNSLEVQDNQLVHRYIDRDEKDNPVERFKPIVEDLKQTLLNIAKVPDNISRLQEQAKPIDERMRTAYASKQEAMRYGGVTQTELKNSLVVQERDGLLKEVEAAQSRIKTLDKKIIEEEKAIEDKTTALKEEVDRLRAKKKTDGQLSTAEEALLKETQSQLTKLTKPITNLKNQRARVQQELDDNLGFIKNRENIIEAKEIEKESRQRPSVEAQLITQTEVLNKKKAEQIKLDEKIAQLNKDKQVAGKDTPEAEKISAELTDKKAEKKALDEEIKRLEARSEQLKQSAQRQKEYKSKHQKSTVSGGATIPIAEGSIFGQLVSAVRDGLSDLRATISDEDLTLLAKDATLQSIVNLLGGDGSVNQPQPVIDETDDNTGYSKNSRKKKLSRTQVVDNVSKDQILAALSSVGEQFSGLESRLLELEEETVDDQKIADTAASSFVNTTQPGGILGIMNSQAELLKQILMTVGEISKKQIASGVAKSNSADDMLARLKQVLGISIAQDKERFMQIDTTTGAMSESVDGKRDEIDGVLLNDMKKVVQKVMNPDMSVHTHGKSNNPDDQYFSGNDIEQIIADFKEGIKKQLLVSEQGLALIDLSKITDINDLEKLFAGQKGGKASFDALQNNDSIKYSTRTWEGITPQKLVNFLGIEGVESKLNATETKDAAIQGVAEEAAKEAAQVVQKSSGAAIKTTFDRIGLEMAKSIEQTDTKGNKTWSTDISNKYQKAMETTYKDIAGQNLGDVFGKGTDAQKALVEYESHYIKLNELVEQFKTADESSKAGIQAQINELIPTFDKAEKKLLGLIARKDKFLGDDKALDTTFGVKELASPRKNLEKLARQMYGGNVNPGGNVAFGGYKRGQGSGQLFIDVLDGQTKTIKTHVLEVDKATGKVKEYTLAESALSNAFQNVNKAMKQNVNVLADIAIGDGPKKQAEWMANASSPLLDAYKNTFSEMQNYTAQLWNSGKAPSQQQLDYLMQLSERVMVLGKELQKTSGEFKNLWDANPDNVIGIDFREDDTVRSAMERYAEMNAKANTSKYEFTSFDNDTLKYKLTDVEGQVHNITLEWNELYEKVRIVSDKSVVALDPLVAKIEKYKQTVADAKANEYLLDTDDAEFNAALQEVETLQQKVKEGTATYEELEAARRRAIKEGSDAEKLAKKNEKLYAGTNELRSAERQNTKILGTLPPIFNKEKSKQFQAYQAEYDKLIAKHKTFADNNKMASVEVQKELQRDAAYVQKLGKQFLASANEAEKLQEAVNNSGSFTNKQGKEIQLGGVKAVAPEEMNNLNAAMRAYAKEVLGAELAHAKFNPTTKQLTGEIRQNNRVVSDMAVKYNEATGQMYLFQKQERESLSGWPGLIHGFKEKSKAIVQYLASMTSIYRIFGMIRQGITYIKEIDAALTELRKVTDETEETYNKFLSTASKTAAKVGSTIKDVVSSTADWARLGYALKDAAKFAESTQILMNVSEFTDVSQATDTLISAVQAFGYTAETSMDVVDLLNTIGNNYAISTADLAQSLTKSSASLVAAGGDLAEAAALTATANAIIQDADAVGTALKTTSLRLRGTSTELLEEEGVDSEGAITSKSKLQGKVKALSGVDILTESGEYKSTYEILSQIADVWEDISNMDQAALLELLAGKRNASVLAAILQAPEQLKAAYEDAQNAEGSALKENEKYLDSIQGKIDQFNNAVQTLWKNTLNDDVVKDVVELGTELIRFIDKIGVIPSILAGVLIYFTAFKKQNPLTIIKDLGEHFVNAGVQATKYGQSLKGLTLQKQAEVMATEGATQAEITEQLVKQNGIAQDQAEKLAIEAVNNAKIKQQGITAANVLSDWAENKVKLSKKGTLWLEAQATNELTKEKLKEALAHGLITKADYAEIASKYSLLTATNALKLGVKGLGAAIKASMASNPIGWILMAVSAVVMLVQAIGNVKEEIKQAAEEALSAYEQTQDTLKSHKETIEDISKDYEKLSKGVDQFGNNVSLTTEEFERYNEIANQIAEMFPDMVTGYTNEGNAIIALKGNVDELTKAYEELAQAARDEMIASSNDVFKNFQNQTSKSRSFWGSRGHLSNQDDLDDLGVLLGGDKDKINDLEDKRGSSAVRQLFKDAGVDFTSFDSTEEILKDPNNISQLQAYYRTLEKTIKNETAKLKPLVNAWLYNDEDYKKLSENSKKIIQQAINNFGAEFYNEFDDFNDVYTYIQTNIIEPLQNTSISAELQTTFDLQTKFNNGEATIQEYQDKVAGLLGVIDALGLENADEIKKSIRLLFEIDDSGLYNSSAQNVAKGLLDDTGDTMVGQLTTTDLDIINRYAASWKIDDSTTYSWEELMRLIEEAKKLEDDSSITDSLSKIKSIEEGYNDLGDAIKEFKEEGAVSSGTLEGLEETFGDTEGFEELYKVLATGEGDVETAIANVANAFIGQKGILSELSEDEKKIMLARLKNLGIINAEEILGIKEKAQTNLDNLTQGYEVDLSRYATAEAAKIAIAQAEGLDITTISDEKLKALAEDYGIDLAAYATTTEAKIALARELKKEELKTQLAGETDETKKKTIQSQLDLISSEDTGKQINEIVNSYFNNPFKFNFDGQVGIGTDFDEELDTKADKEREEAWENLLKKHQAELDAIVHEKELIQAEIDAAEARGEMASEQYYADLIALENEETAALEAKQAAIEKFYNDNKNSMSPEELEEYQSEWRETELAIKESTTAIYEHQEALRELDSEYFNKVSEDIDAINEEIEFMYGLLEDEPVADENGNWSNEALTRLGLYTQQMEKAAFETQRAKDELAELQATTSEADKNTDWYREREEELTQAIYDGVNSYNDAKDGIVELNEARIEAIKEGIEKEIEAYNDLIENKKEALDAERDLYDFKKNIEEQNKSIADTERKLAALSGSTAAEDIAERKRLEAELRKQQGSLDDTYYDHSMTAQQNALDEEGRYFEEAQQRRIESLEAMLENTEELIVNSMMDVMLNADTVHQTLNEQANTYGVTLSEELTKPWLDASAQAITWRDELKADMGEGEWAKMIGPGGAITAFTSGVGQKFEGSWNTAKTAAEKYADFLTGTELKNDFSGAVTTFTNQLQKIVDKWNEIRDAANAAYKAQSAYKVDINYGDTGSGDGGGGDKTENPSKEEEPTVKLRGLMKTSREMILGSKSFVDENTETINGVKYYRDSKTGYYYKISDLNSNRKYDGGRTTGWAIPKGTWFYTKHAKGTLGTKHDEWALTDELGPELTMYATKDGTLSFMRAGSTVIPAELTKELMDIGAVGLNGLMKPKFDSGINVINNAINKPEYNLNVEALVKADHIDQNSIKDVEKMVNKQLDEFARKLNYSLKSVGGR